MDNILAVRRALTLTDTVALPASPSHMHSLHSMRDSHLLHSDLIHQDVQLVEIRWYCQTLHIHHHPVSTCLLIQTTAHFCTIAAIALGLASVMVIALHCRPIKQNYTIPFEDPRYCFRLKPCVVTIAVLGVVLDAVIWCLPHYVVWHLKLRHSHRVAVSVIFAFGLLCDQGPSSLNHD